VHCSKALDTHAFEDDTGLVRTDPEFKDHIVAVAEGGEVFTKGRGWHGELGIGERVFDLGAGKGDGEEGREFAEGWVGVDLRDVREGMRVRRVYTGEGTTFLVAEQIGAEEGSA